MSAVTQLRTNRRGAEETPSSRTSDIIAAEIADLRRERTEAEDALAALEASYDAAILKGDDAAEAHEQETMRVKRTLRRLELRFESELPALERELEEAREREEAERVAAVQAAAEKEIGAFLATFAEAYREHAEPLAALMTEFSRLSVVAKEAGVPSLNDRLRPPRASVQHPDTVEEETVTVWIDPSGVEHSSKPQPSVMVENRYGGLVAKDSNEFRGWRTEKRKKTVRSRGAFEPGFTPPQLLTQVCLPGIASGEANFFPKAS